MPMKIGIFTDSYFPQVSGVATSIKTLRDALEEKGHEVYIFTTTDPNAKKDEPGIIRMPSVPFISFKDRRVVVRGMYNAYRISKKLKLDLIHTQTEFGVGVLGKMVAHQLEIPCIHTYHTMYEDYLHYIANGKIIRPVHVKLVSRAFAKSLSGIICPSMRVVETLKGYGIQTPFRVIPTGIELSQYQHQKTKDMKKELDISEEEEMLLSLSRISFEKNIQEVLKGLKVILKEKPKTKLVIAGKGPYEDDLKELAEELEISDHVIFVGEVPHDEVGNYYQSADYFVSCSTSESQGLTYIEALVSKVPCVVCGNDYIDSVFDDPAYGVTFSDPEDFAKTFLTYVSQPKKEVSKMAYEDKLYNLSAEKFVNDVLDFYEYTRENYTSPEEKKRQRPLQGRRMKKVFRLKKETETEEEQ